MKVTILSTVAAKFTKKEAKIFVTIFLVTIILRFWGLSSAEVLFDNATNSVRAIGWFDFLTGSGQTTPIVWFGYIPWWANLSFHDHPPLVFALQWLSAQLLGQGSLAMHTAYALAMLGAGVVAYLIARKFISRQTGLWALGLFSLSSYSIWIGRSGYLEGIQIFFITLSFFYCLRYVLDAKDKDLYFWFGATALALASKYTSLFLLPAGLVIFLLYRRQLFRNKNFWLALGLFVLLLAPIIFYNFMLLQTRGHFDAALSSMLGWHPADYSVLKRSINASVGQNIVSLWQTLKAVDSPPFFLLEITSLVSMFYRIIRRKARQIEVVIGFNLLFLILMFAFAGVTARFLTIVLPFITILFAILLTDVFSVLKKRWSRVVVGLFLVLVFGWELFYSLNTNFLLKPVGLAGRDFAESKFYYQGFGKLDQYLRQEVYGKLPPMRHITKFTAEVTNYNLAGKEAIIFDERTDWNSRMWYVFRYQHYYYLPIVYPSDIIASALKEPNSARQTFFGFLNKTGAKGYWLVYATHPNPSVGMDQQYTDMMDNMVTALQKSGVQPVVEIPDYTGQTAFQVYHFQAQ